MKKEKSFETLLIAGGALCFDFINTVSAWRPKNYHEYLPDYNEFIRWCEIVAVLPSEELEHLKSEARAHPGQADRALKIIIYTRQVLFDFFSALAANDPQGMTAALPSFNKALNESFSSIGFAITAERLGLVYHKQQPDLLTPLRKILLSAYNILTTEDLTRIKECPTCKWVFYDRTKNGKRRWCSSDSCGTADKMKRYYHKKTKA